jgi:hypothetical protein
MPDIGIGKTSRGPSARTLEALAELGGAGFEDAMRRDAAARLLVLARRHLIDGPRAGADAALVRRTVAGWDAAATTAAEHVEAMPVTALEAFLAAARRWALAVAGNDAAEPLRQAA